MKTFHRLTKKNGISLPLGSVIFQQRLFKLDNGPVIGVCKLYKVTEMFVALWTGPMLFLKRICFVILYSKTYLPIPMISILSK